MNNTNLIITLIQQDLKHNQLVKKLESIGLETGGKHFLSIIDIVSKLMGVSGGQVEDDWSLIYISYMNMAAKYEVTENGSNLRPLADICYKELNDILKEKHGIRLTHTVLSSPPKQPHEQADGKQHYEYVEDNFSDAGCSTGKTGKSEYGGYQGNDKKYDDPS